MPWTFVPTTVDWLLRLISEAVSEARRVLLPAFQNCLQHAWCSSKLSTVSQVRFSVIFHHLDVSEKYHQINAKKMFNRIS